MLEANRWSNNSCVQVYNCVYLHESSLNLNNEQFWNEHKTENERTESPGK